MLDRSLSPRAGLTLLILSLLGLAGLAAFLLSDSSAPPEEIPAFQRPRVVADADLPRFAGNQACATCHPDTFRAHHHSRHAATLHPMAPGQLPVPFPDRAQLIDGDTGLRYQVERRQNRYYFQVLAPDGPRSEPIEFAFGSGKTGLTFVGRAPGGTIRELRMSYFPSRRRWEVTPGQRSPTGDPLGTVQDHRTSQRCFGCHATVVPASGVVPEPRFQGVGCEACHGPGRAHIEAVQRGDTDRRIDNPGRWDGQQVNELCGRCHRSEREIDPLDTFNLAQTQRFQPMGLAKSACFRASAGRLSCLTCHDPHADTRTDAAHYEAACRTCHRPAPTPNPSPNSGGGGTRRLERRPLPSPEVGGGAGGGGRRAIAAKVCPVNPRDGCVTCHMPRREVVRGITMADHWIRVFRSPAAGGRPGAL
jgi:hypothetical protein